MGTAGVRTCLQLEADRLQSELLHYHDEMNRLLATNISEELRDANSERYREPMKAISNRLTELDRYGISPATPVSNSKRQKCPQARIMDSSVTRLVTRYVQTLKPK